MFLFILIIILVYAEVASASHGHLCANQSTICGANCQSLLKEFKTRFSHGWAIRHESLGRTFEKLGCAVIIEIGIARGELSKYLLHKLPHIIREYNAVDPFLGGYDNANDAMSSELSVANAPSDWRDAILTMFHSKDCTFRLHFGTSEDCAENFEDESVDCLFIDGDHRYSGIKKDLVNYAPKVKRNGFIIFDDYSKQFVGVVKAVDELCDINRLKFHKINSHNNYYIQKPNNRPLNTTYTYPADESIPLPPIPTY
jgi:hypothetical protein